MDLTYDPECNIAYIRMKRKTGKIRTVRVSDELNADIAADGSVYGIEFLNANVQLNVQRSKKITLKNVSSGESCELPLVG
jgi:uncharacterized protein YuzE